MSLTLPAGMFNAPSAAPPRPLQPLRSARAAPQPPRTRQSYQAPPAHRRPMQAIVVALAVVPDGDQVGGSASSPF